MTLKNVPDIDESSRLDVASRFGAAKRNTAEPIEPDFLPDLVLGVHMYLGTLPKEHCHMYLEVIKLMYEYDPWGDGPAATERTLARIELARKMFCQSVRKFFTLYVDENSRKEFVICKGWKVGLVDLVNTEEVTKTAEPATNNPDQTQWNAAATAFNGRFIEDMM